MVFSHIAKVIRVGGGVKESLRTLWRKDFVVLNLLAFFIAASAFFAFFVGEFDRFSLFIYPGVAVFSLTVVGVGFFIVYSLYLLLILRPEKPVTFLIGRVSGKLKQVGVARVLLMVMFFSFFLSAVSSLKTLIPIINPFSWDYFFYEMDRLIMGGHQPWQLLHSLISTLDLTMPINALYNGWFFFVFGVLLWQILDVPNPRRREVYLVSYILCWVVNGTILATIFSSAGPAFFGRIYPGLENPYQPLMSYLAVANEGNPIWALAIQDYLWDVYSTGSLQIGSGISAMPSMHVSLAWLGFLLFCRVQAGLAVLVFLYVVVILVGSVHLAWHYAADGILAVATTTIIWRMVDAWYRSVRMRSR